MTEIEILDYQIAQKEAELAALIEKRKKLVNEDKVKLNETAYKNALKSMFDGIKYVADINNPFVLNLPMLIIPNMYYKYNDKIYVGMSKEVATEDNFDNVLIPYDIEDDTDTEEAVK